LRTTFCPDKFSTVLASQKIFEPSRLKTVWQKYAKAWASLTGGMRSRTEAIGTISFAAPLSRFTSQSPSSSGHTVPARASCPLPP
jgi:hypothetical protein